MGTRETDTMSRRAGWVKWTVLSTGTCLAVAVAVFRWRRARRRAAAGVGQEGRAPPLPPKKAAREVQFHCSDFVWEEELAEVGQAAVAQDGSARLHEEDVHDADAWECFFQQSRNRFFKDRAYLKVLLDEELQEAYRQGSLVACELGCGVGNSVFPIMKAACECGVDTVHIHAVDFSETAIACLSSDPRREEASAPDSGADPRGGLMGGWHRWMWSGRGGQQDRKIIPLVADVSSEYGSEAVLEQVAESTADLVLMIYSLSAVPPPRMRHVMALAHRLLRPGGRVLIRDYGLYDLAQMRFASSGGKRLQRGGYLRGDGTRTFFLSQDDVRQLAEEAGLQVLDCKYHTVRLRNRKSGLEMNRVWLHARLWKPEELPFMLL